ncbi:MAG TPA: thioredoxin domain-containing protein [Pseudonocardia sp.]
MRNPLVQFTVVILAAIGITGGVFLGLSQIVTQVTTVGPSASHVQASCGLYYMPAIPSLSNADPVPLLTNPKILLPRAEYTEQCDRATSWQPYVAWALTGVGLVGLVVIFVARRQRLAEEADKGSDSSPGTHGSAAAALSPDRAQRQHSPARRVSTWTLVSTLVGSLIAGVCLWGLYRAFSAKEQPAPVPSAATDANAIPIGRPNARIRVDVYLDMHCADCRTWEETAGPILDEAVSDGSARVVYHPLAFLARDSSTRYSTRAAAAAGCASESGAYVAYQRLLFAEQPPRGGEGLSEERLIELGRQAGAREPFAACVRERRYEPWVTKMTTQAYSLGVKVTPTILVDNDRIASTDVALRKALAGTR